jgi:hypothetical protein
MNKPPEPRNSVASATRSLSDFVGRRQQLRQLQRGMQDVLAGHPRMICLVGESGSGKTRLLKEAQAMALRHGLQVYLGRGFEDLSLPYLPFAEALWVPLGQLPEEVRRAYRTEVETVRQALRFERSTTALDRPDEPGCTAHPGGGHPAHHDPGILLPNPADCR